MWRAWLSNSDQLVSPTKNKMKKREREHNYLPNTETVGVACRGR